MARWSRFLATLDTVRDVARELSLYGCHTRSELEQRRIKARRYDEALRRLRAFNGRQIRTARRGKAHAQQYHIRPFQRSGNYLWYLYHSHTITVREICLQIIMQQIMASRETLSLQELQEEIWASLTDDEQFGEELVSANTIRLHANELVDRGIWQRFQSGRKTVYRLSPDPFGEGGAGLNDREVRELLTAVQCMARMVNPSVPGYFLARTLRRYLRWERRAAEPADVPLVSRYIPLYAVLDENLLWKLIQAQREKVFVLAVHNGSTGKRRPIRLLPVRFFLDTTNGRWYVIGCGRRRKRCRVLPPLRLDMLEDVIFEQKCSDVCDSDVEKVIDSLPTSSWLVGFGRQSTKEVRLIVDKTALTPFLEALLRKMRTRASGIVDSDHECELTIHTADPRELLPHLRMFGPAIRVLPGGDHSLETELQSGWQEVLRNYGAL
ncbi:MAG: WYL domain-containing protein [Firmicutes bacterium]|nr:WYL domain-containing protein [Bacillota bacterium]